MSMSFLDRLDADRAFAHLRRLAGDIGVRVAGTDPEWQGADYLAEAFRDSGLEAVTETFPIPVWQERQTELMVDGQAIPAISPCFGGCTSRQGIATELPISAHRRGRDGRRTRIECPGGTPRVRW